MGEELIRQVSMNGVYQEKKASGWRLKSLTKGLKLEGSCYLREGRKIRDLYGIVRMGQVESSVMVVVMVVVLLW